MRARGVSVAFGDHTVLRDLDLEVAAGERTALLGLNGSGKTTLLRCLLGLVPFEGEIEIDGRDVRREGRAVRTRTGYVPQRPPHFDGTLAELVELVAGLRAEDPVAVGRRLDDLDLRLAEHGDKPVRALSGGMLQKALLALATAGQVPLLLLDEPTANLDARARREFVRALGAVPEGTAVLLASHRLEDIEAVAERLVVLHGGGVAFDGTLAELRHTSAGAPVLWLGVDPERRDAVAERLAADPRVLAVERNGRAVGARVAPEDQAALVAALRGEAVEVRELRTEAPPLETLLAGLLGEP